MSEPREPVFFSDRDLGKQFPALLIAAGVRIERHDDHFNPEATDEQWLGQVGQRKWVAISRDARIRYSPLALTILMESGTKLFVLVGKLKTTEAAELFLKWRARIVSTSLDEAGAFIAKVRRDGVHVWLREQEWRRRKR